MPSKKARTSGMQKKGTAPNKKNMSAKPLPKKKKGGKTIKKMK